MFYQFNWEVVIVLFSLIVYVQYIYAMFAMYRKVNVQKHASWHKESLETALTAAEFVQKVQKFCLRYKWNLIEITDHDATIRTYPVFWHWGMFFYIEFVPGEKNAVNVFTRGAIFKSSFYRPLQKNMLNQLFKV